VFQEPNTFGVGISFYDVNGDVIIARPKNRESTIRDMSFINCHESRIVFSHQFFQMSSSIVILSPSNIPREDGYI